MPLPLRRPRSPPAASGAGVAARRHLGATCRLGSVVRNKVKLNFIYLFICSFIYLFKILPMEGKKNPQKSTFQGKISTICLARECRVARRWAALLTCSHALLPAVRNSR